VRKNHTFIHQRQFLELAVNGNAELIVSGDEDLLILNPFQEIAIVTVRQFLEME